MMTTSNLLELAAIEGAITRMTAMKEAAVKHSAPAETLEYADSQIRSLLNEKAALLLNNTVQPNHAFIERKAALNARLLDAALHPSSPLAMHGEGAGG